MKLDVAICIVLCFILTSSVPYSSYGVTLRDLSCRKMVDQMEVEKVFRNISKNSKQRRDFEIMLAKLGRVIKRCEKVADISRIWIRLASLVHLGELAQFPFEEASDQLNKKFGLSPNEISKLPASFLNGKHGKRAKDNCLKFTATAVCDSFSYYRRADGQCNNLQNPKWGSAGNCQQRLLPANYEGISRFRHSVVGGKLPSPRHLSLNFHRHLNKPISDVNHMYMFFGQLLDHDLTVTPGSTTVDNQAIQCCPWQNQTHPQCAHIPIRKNDPFYSKFGTTCMNFVRSLICPTCSLGPRRQINQVTSLIDASFVYGSSENDTRALRANDGTGRLRIQKSKYGDLLPPSSDPDEDGCSIPGENKICFEAGDSRVNQHTTLASLHTIFLREHNRIADDLCLLNPHWNDEAIFQETRRIIAAQIQSIVYGEYLPITLSADRMDYFRLWTGNLTKYDPKINPTMITEFTTAAFRFGHSMVNSVVSNRYFNSTKGYRLLRDDFFRTHIIRKGGLNCLVRGTSDTPAQMMDEHLVPDVANYLYRNPGERTGLDLASINIQRGRDHGLPTYVQMVEYCSGGDLIIASFIDLVIYDLMDAEQADALERNYKSVKDVDLWPGILMEIPMSRAMVGPTASCIIGNQFHRLKYGDRFYFEHKNEVSFTFQQMQEIRKTTLTDIICLNTEITRLPQNAMLFASKDNPYIDCRSMKGVDLSYWRE